MKVLWWLVSVLISVVGCGRVKGFSLLGRGGGKKIEPGSSKKAALSSNLPSSSSSSSMDSSESLQEGTRKHGFYRNHTSQDKKGGSPSSNSVSSSFPSDSVSECCFVSSENPVTDPSGIFYIPSKHIHVYEQNAQNTIKEIKKQLQMELKQKQQKEQQKQQQKSAAASSPSSPSDINSLFPSLWLECSVVPPTSLSSIQCQGCLYNEHNQERSHVRAGLVKNLNLEQCMKGDYRTSHPHPNGEEEFEFKPLCQPLVPEKKKNNTITSNNNTSSILRNNKMISEYTYPNDDVVQDDQQLLLQQPQGQQVQTNLLSPPTHNNVVFDTTANTAQLYGHHYYHPIKDAQEFHYSTITDHDGDVLLLYRDIIMGGGDPTSTTSDTTQHNNRVENMDDIWFTQQKTDQTDGKQTDPTHDLLIGYLPAYYHHKDHPQQYNPQQPDLQLPHLLFYYSTTPQELISGDVYED